MNRPATLPISAAAVEFVHHVQRVVSELDTTALSRADLCALAEYFERTAQAFNRKAFSKLATHVGDQLSIEPKTQ